MGKIKFTKGELKVFEDEDDGNIYLDEIIGEDESYIVAERISSIHDANLFKAAHKMYARIESLNKLLESLGSHVWDEIDLGMVVNDNEDLLAEARGEICEC